MGRPTMDNMVLTIPTDPRQGPAGQYTVQYRVTGSDGHLIVGNIAFNLTAPFGQPSAAAQQETATAPTAAPPGQDGGAPIWIWIMGVVIVGGVAFVALWLRRTGKSD
jgi:hypothetical protein